jgi:hypothetical protein
MTSFCPNCHEASANDISCEHCGADMLLEGRWRLEDFLGHGANGYTWKARNLESDEVFAIKELSFRRLTDLKQLELFEREVDALKSLEHANVPTYFDNFVVESERFVSAYLVQEFIDGSPLDTSGRTDEDDVRGWLLAMSDILDSLHSRRPPVIHRDIKPSNVMRRSDGSYVLIDFGSILAAAEATVGGSTVAGTLGYMAPEQLVGKATPASDFYGLGATAVALLAGRDASEIVDAHKPGQWRRKVEVSDGLADVLEKLLEPDADDRIDSGKALRRALEKSLESKPSLAERFAEWRKERSEKKRRNKAASEALEQKSRRARDDDSILQPTLVEVALAIVVIIVLLIVGFVAEPEVIHGFFQAARAGDLGSLLFGLVVASLMSLVQLQFTFVSDFLQRHIWKVAAIWLPVALAGVAWLTFHPPSSGERVDQYSVSGQEIRRSVRYSAVGACLLTIKSTKEGLVRVKPINGNDDNGCVWVRQNDDGTLWVERTDDGVESWQLIDLWDGSVVWDSTEEFDGIAERKDVNDDRLLLAFPDGTSREFSPNPQRNNERDKSVDFLVERARHTSGTEYADGFRAKTLSNDGVCADLMLYNTTSFGPGEWRIARDTGGTPAWFRPVSEMVGAPDIDASLSGRERCWLEVDDEYFAVDVTNGMTRALELNL